MQKWAKIGEPKKYIALHATWRICCKASPFSQDMKSIPLHPYMKDLMFFFPWDCLCWKSCLLFTHTSDDCHQNSIVYHLFLTCCPFLWPPRWNLTIERHSLHVVLPWIPDFSSQVLSSFTSTHAPTASSTPKMPFSFQLLIFFLHLYSFGPNSLT